MQGSYELLNCFVTVRPSSSFLRFVHPSYSRLPCHRVELCRVVCVRSSSGETTPLSFSLSLSSISIVASVLRCWQPPSPLSPCRVPRMLGIVSGIVLAYPLTSYLWDSNVRKIDTGTPLFAYGDSPDGPQGITVA